LEGQPSPPRPPLKYSTPLIVLYCMYRPTTPSRPRPHHHTTPARTALHNQASFLHTSPSREPGQAPGAMPFVVRCDDSLSLSLSLSLSVQLTRIFLSLASVHSHLMKAGMPRTRLPIHASLGHASVVSRIHVIHPACARSLSVSRLSGALPP
jgi:hypothetical protein